ncbi:unnamed protein product [Arctogadus glacialis]
MMGLKHKAVICVVFGMRVTPSGQREPPSGPRDHDAAGDDVAETTPPEITPPETPPLQESPPPLPQESLGAAFPVQVFRSEKAWVRLQDNVRTGGVTTRAA